jgi:hypothetical protein
MAEGFDGNNLTKYHGESKQAYRARFNTLKSLRQNHANYSPKEVSYTKVSGKAREEADQRVKSYHKNKRLEFRIALVISITLSLTFFIYTLYKVLS